MCLQASWLLTFSGHLRSDPARCVQELAADCSNSQQQIRTNCNLVRSGQIWSDLDEPEDSGQLHVDGVLVIMNDKRIFTCMPYTPTEILTIIIIIKNRHAHEQTSLGCSRPG